MWKMKMLRKRERIEKEKEGEKGRKAGGIRVRSWLKKKKGVGDKSERWGRKRGIEIK